MMSAKGVYLGMDHYFFKWGGGGGIGLFLKNSSTAKSAEKNCARRAMGRKISSKCFVLSRI